MSEKTANSFEKGLNRDVHPSMISKNEYVDGRNIVLNNKNGSLYSVSNEEGFTLLPDFSTKKPDYIPIGVCCLNDEIIVFSVNTVNNSSEVGILDQSGNYFTVLNDSDPNYWFFAVVKSDQKLNFNINKHINSTARIGFNGDRIVYWTDDLNYPRFLNLDIDYTVNRFRNISDQTKLQDTYKYPHVEFKEIVDGGQLKCGVYQFAARYLNDTLDPTGFGYTSNIIPIVNENRSVGVLKYDGENFDAAPVAKSIKINISNIDLNYKFIEVAAIYYSGSSSQFKSAIFTRQAINSPTMSFVFDGKLKEEEILPEDLQVSPNIYSSASQIIQKDGILFLANLTKSKLLDLQPIANRVKIGYDIEEQDAGFEYWQDNSDQFTGYKDEYNTFKKKTYHRGEVYSFALVGKTKSGEETFAYHIPAKLPSDFDFLPFDEGGKYFTKVTGELGAYLSDIKYNKRSYYYDETETMDLYGGQIRHHLMPDISLEPTFYTDPVTNKSKIRLIKLSLLNLMSALNSYPEIRDELESISLVMEERNSFSKKSIFSQGFANTMLKQDGVVKKMVRAGGKKNIYFAGETDNKIEDDGGFEEDDALPITDNIESYIPNPFFGNTHIHDYNSAVFINGRIGYYLMENGGAISHGVSFSEDQGFCGTNDYFSYAGMPVVTGNEITADVALDGDCLNTDHRGSWSLPDYCDNWTGQSSDQSARSSCAFYSPESIFLKSNFNLPVGSYIVPIMETVCKPDRELPPYTIKTGNSPKKNGRIDVGMELTPYDIHLGNYAGFIQYPLSLKMRSPFFYVKGHFNKYNNILSSLASWQRKNVISASKLTSWNDVVKTKEDLSKLTTYLKDTNRLINNYDCEGYRLLELNNTLILPDSMPFITCVIGGTKEYVAHKDRNCLWNYDWGFDYLSKYINNINDDQCEYELGEDFGGTFTVYRTSAMNEIFLGAPTICTSNTGTDTVGYLSHSNQTVHRDPNIPQIDGATPITELTTRDSVIWLPEYRLEHRLGATVARVGFDYGTTDITPGEEDNEAWQILHGTTAPNGEQSRYLYNIQTDNRTQYGELDSNEYIRIETFYNQEIADECNQEYIKSFMSDFIGDIFNGDTFINEFSYRNSSRMYYRFAWRNPDNSTIYNETGVNMPNTVYGGFTRIEQKEGAEMKALNTFFVESSINCDYRHREVSRDEDGNPTKPGVPYFPKSNPYEVFDAEPEFGQSDGYNVQYSKLNNTKKFFLQPFGYEDITDFPTRIIYSLETLEGEQSDKYRQIKPNNFQDLPKNKGEITNLFTISSTMYANTDRSLWRLFVNSRELIPTSTQQIILGTGGVLSQPPQEIYDIKGGYCGTQHDRSGIMTPFGYVFVDYLQRKVFLFNGDNAPEEISQMGLYNFFQENLTASDNNIQNPDGIGIISFYEPNHKRLIISNRSGNYFTVSFSFFTKQWISFHDYSPDLTVTLDDKLYSFKNGEFYQNEGGLYGLLYKELFKSYITTVVAENTLSDKVFDSISCFSETYDRSNLKPHLRFFNYLNCWNDYQNSGEIKLVVKDLSKKERNIYLENVNWLNSQFQISTPLSATIDNYKDLFDPTNINIKAKNKARLRSKYLFQKFIFDNTEDDLRFVLISIINNFRYSIR